MKKFKVGDKFTGFKFESYKFIYEEYDLKDNIYYDSWSMDNFVGVKGVIKSVGKFHLRIKFPNSISYWTYPINQEGLPAGLYNPKHISNYEKI